MCKISPNSIGARWTDEVHFVSVNGSYSFNITRDLYVTSGDRIFVTSNLYKVRTLARDGTVLHTFIDPDLKYPHGIHVTDLGQVLVCDNWGGSDTIIQLDTEGKKKLATIATEHSIHNCGTIL
ncbi:hypothetical protein DPMN_063246 [Dreissena polymorpha]|uniref:Uncharacterized protein n=1 Tax=Dreissena polymorpha TaxID=45954 RepID=A0A9D4HJZ1_DREPO|nr:hypothetical protein DPMN_063246 [Dreissena polymorpha]